MSVCVQVAQIALPVFLRRVKSILREYRTSKNADRLQLENCLCCLDTLAAMTLSPAVTDVVLPPGSRLKVKPLVSAEFMLLRWQGI